MNLIPQIMATGVGSVVYIHDRGYGFLRYSLNEHSHHRIYFNFADAANADLKVGQAVAFDIALDERRRLRAYRVRHRTASDVSSEVRP